MGSKKNIDRLFQEQFKNFEAIPNETMWDAIHSKLDEETSRKKRFPVWMLFSGVAAILLLFAALSLTFSFDNIESLDALVSEENQSNSNQNNEVFKDEKQINIVNQNTNNYSDSELNINKNATIVDAVNQVENRKSNLIKESVSTLNKVVDRNVKLVTNNQNSKSSRSDNLSDNGSFIDRNNNSLINKTAKIASNNSNNKNVTKSKLDIVKGNKSYSDILNSNMKLNAQNVGYNNDTAVEYSNIGKTNSINANNQNLTSNKQNELLAKNEENENKLLSDNLNINSENHDKNLEGNNVVANTNLESEDEELESNSADNESSEEVCEVESKEESIDKTIEEAIAELEENQEEENNEEKDGDIVKSKWKIAPNIAPVYYNTLSSGSPINDDLSGNKKKGKINMSYGLGVGYAINKKLTLRTGVNKMSLGFDTEDVAVNVNSGTAQVSDTRGMKNINLSPAAAALNIANADSFTVAQIPSSYSSLYNSSLNQRLGYLEVPVELSYKVSDKKMKIDVIAGVSTFFLSENDIYTETNGIETHIGEANNLNKISYSTNVGLGFNYAISKTFNFNFEPTFKYQLNAFSNDSGNFKPYILGVYTGFSFKF